MAYDETGALRMVMPSHDLFLNIELLVVPAWMPPLSIQDNAALHYSVLQSLGKLNTTSDRGTVGESLRSIIATCWWGRLPLDGVDIWPMLAAHGFDPRFRPDVIDYFDFGTKLLTSTNGRPAVKRRRMLAFSKGRYLTKAQREMWLKLFGYD